MLAQLNAFVKDPVEIGFRAVGLLYVMTFGLAAFDKFSLGATPDWFTAQFNQTFMAHLPGGLPFVFFSLAVLEAITSATILVAVLRPHPVRKQNLFLYGLSLGVLVFTMLSFGQRLTHGYDQAGNLMVYGVLTFLVLAVCRPDYGGSRK